MTYDVFEPVYHNNSSDLKSLNLLYFQALLYAILEEAPIQQAAILNNKDTTQRMRQVRYLVTKNLAGLLSKQDITVLQALMFYQDGLNLDPDDSLLWMRLGQLVSLHVNKNVAPSFLTSSYV